GRQRHHDYTPNLINSQVLPSYEDTSLPAILEYRALMQDYRGMPPDLAIGDYQPMPLGYISLEGFLDAKCLVKMLEALGKDLDRTKLRTTVGAMQSVDLGIGQPASFAPGRAQGLDRIYYTTVEKDRYVTITEWSRWKL